MPRSERQRTAAARPDRRTGDARPCGTRRRRLRRVRRHGRGRAVSGPRGHRCARAAAVDRPVQTLLPPSVRDLLFTTAGRAPCRWTLSDLQDLLKASMGLTWRRSGRPRSSARCRSGSAPAGLDDLRDYWARVRGSGVELQALIEAVVVTETWFFRDREAFAALARRASARVAVRATRRRAPAAEPALLDRRRTLFDGDGAARRRRAREPLPHRRRRHQRARARARPDAACTGGIPFAANELGFRDRHFER